MSRDAERLYFLRRQLADLRSCEPTIQRCPQNSWRIHKTRKNIKRVEEILRELSSRVIAEASGPAPIAARP